MLQTDHASKAASLSAAATRLRVAGVPDADRESRWLLAAVLQTQPADLWRHEELGERDQRRFSALVERRAKGEPLAYVVGEQPFRDTTVVTDRRALIPRPETEGLVDVVLTYGRRRWSETRWGKVVDVGTGTGCIALALEAEGRFSTVMAVDRSRAALSLARENVRRVSSSIRLLTGDLTTCLGPRSVDMIVANPPYLTTTEYETLDDSVSRYEPHMALVSGSDGLDVTRSLFADGRRCIRPGGMIAVEVDVERAELAADAAERTGWQMIRTTADLTGRPRYITAQWEIR